MNLTVTRSYWARNYIFIDIKRLFRCSFSLELSPSLFRIDWSIISNLSHLLPEEIQPTIVYNSNENWPIFLLTMSDYQIWTPKEYKRIGKGNKQWDLGLSWLVCSYSKCCYPVMILIEVVDLDCRQLFWPPEHQCC